MQMGLYFSGLTSLGLYLGGLIFEWDYTQYSIIFILVIIAAVSPMSCHASKHGCCWDGITVAGPNKIGCPGMS